MSGYEEQLHARAEMLDETGELAAAVTAILGGASSAGVDPDAIVSLRAAIAALDPAGGPPGYQAGSRADRHPGSGYGSDSEFLEAVSDAEDQIRGWLGDTERLQEQVDRRARQGTAPTWNARTGTWKPPGRPWPPRTPCPPRTRATAATPPKPPRSPPPRQPSPTPSERISDATRRIGICEDTAEILDPLTRRLQAALQALRQVPHDLGEVYELIYAVHPPRRENAALRPVDRGSHTCISPLPGRYVPTAASQAEPRHLTRSPVQQSRYRCHRLRAGRRPDRYRVPPRRLPDALTAVGAGRACIALTTRPRPR